MPSSLDLNKNETKTIFFLNSTISTEASRLQKKLLLQTLWCWSGTCVDSQVHPQVTWVAEGFAAVAALVWPHTHMTHEVHVEFGGCGKGSRAHAAFKLPLSAMTLTVSAGLSFALSLALPWRRRAAAGGLAGQLILGVGLTVYAMSRIFLGGAVAVGVAAEVSFELREGGALFSTVADLSLWNVGDACRTGFRKNVIALHAFVTWSLLVAGFTCTWLCSLLASIASFVFSLLPLSLYLCSSCRLVSQMSFSIGHIR